MATAPYGLRLLVGAAVTAVEETLKLPQTIMMYPMTVASTVAQVVMKVQQDLADLAIKGDAALENLFPPSEEQPEWATFDDDLAGEADPRQDGGGRRTEGRFALYSVTDEGEPNPAKAAKKAAVKNPRRTAAPTTAVRPGGRPAPEAPAAPAIIAELDYDELTLAQLRARMPNLSVADLRALLAYEDAGRARAPFQTLLANRITRATAK